MIPRKILVTGADGQLGKELRAQEILFPDSQFLFFSRSELSVEKEEELRLVFEREKPSFCINCAAYTAVDKAESDRDNAFLINAEAVGLLAKTCRSVSSRFIHISTDYVFDGNSSRPLLENDQTAPINVYGESKLRGEELARKEDPGALIIRTAWVYSEFGNNFVKTMIRLMKEREAVNVINDQIGSPTYAADLASAILKICHTEKFVPGIFHYSNAGRISWYDFACAIKELTGSRCKVNPISSSEYPTAARRPKYSLLNTAKIASTYSLAIPEWKSSLEKCLERIQRLV
jgi:dTDP-4-dehydrorhamnose reductase